MEGTEKGEMRGHSRRKRSAPTPISRKMYAALAAAMLGGIVAASLGQSWGSGVFVTAFVAMMPLFWISAYRRSTAWKHQTEEEDEAAWEARNRVKQEMLEIAKDLYAKGPIGKWEALTKDLLVHGVENVLNHRWIIFKHDGTGEYGWMQRYPLPVSVRTRFDYERKSESVLRVRITEPRTDHRWHEFTYVLEVRGSEGTMELTLSFEGDCPLEAELTSFWPFWGELIRIPMTRRELLDAQDRLG